ncbi:MAG: non-ribosomal peptide synthetase, partial [bacterium]|nr:non-ribosomal peptide synthetase [bacterium]
DQQVKIRGFRIELGEIESQLLKHPSIKEAVVIDRMEESGEKYLCAYFVSTETVEHVEHSELKKHLSKKLPDYMIPSHFVALDAVPLTPNGKVDRKALPAPEFRAAAADAAPADEIEEKLVILWSEILNIDKGAIGVDADFFQLGGHSLKATILTARIHKVLDVKISLTEIFRLPTIRELARHVRESAPDKYASISKAETKEYYALSSVQKRLYVLQQLEPESTAYNMPQVISLDVTEPKEKWQEIFKQLIRRHESLRTSFIMVNGEPVQKIHQDVEFEIGLGEAPSSLGEAPSLPRFVRPFDLSRAPLLRVALVKLPEDKNIFMMDMHHIITDGMSQGILEKEFSALLAGTQLAPLQFQYKDYAEWRNREARGEYLKRQEQYWLNRFSGELPVLNLPWDFPRPGVQSFEGSNETFSIGSEETAALKALAAAEETTLYMVLLFLFNLLLARLSSLEDIIVGSPVAGRRHADLEKIVGMFVNTLAMRNYPAGEKTAAAFLREVRESTLEAFENQDYPFEDLVETVSAVRDLGRNPVFDAFFTLQNLGDPQEADPGPESTGEPPPAAPGDETGAGVSKFDISLYAAENKDIIDFSFEYCAKLFNKDT